MQLKPLRKQARLKKITVSAEVTPRYYHELNACVNDKHELSKWPRGETAMQASHGGIANTFQEKKEKKKKERCDRRSSH